MRPKMKLQQETVSHRAMTPNFFGAQQKHFERKMASELMDFGKPGLFASITPESTFMNTW